MAINTMKKMFVTLNALIRIWYLSKKIFQIKNLNFITVKTIKSKMNFEIESFLKS